MKREEKEGVYDLTKFKNQIQTITCFHELQLLKESIKDEVMNPLLRWDERMVLYKQVQLINEWISQLHHISKTTG